MTPEQWAAVDWRWPNRVLIRKLARSEPQVSEMRRRYGHPATLQAPIAPAKLSDAAKDVCRKKLKACREKNIAATVARWECISPAGIVWRGKNLRAFVRDHGRLFHSADIKMRTAPSGRTTCRAMGGLYAAARVGGEWKGWKCRKLNS